jgi:hypothetical protein
MRMFLIAIIALSLGCGGSSATVGLATTLTGAYSLSEVDRSTAVPACFPSAIDPSNTVYLVRATLTFDVTGKGTLDAVYETRRNSDEALVSTGDSISTMTYVRAGSNLTITYKGSPRNGSVQPGDASLWTLEPWCTGVVNPATTQRFDFAR